MKRPWRFLFHATTLLSFMIFLATASIFVRSEFVGEKFTKTHFDLPGSRYVETFIDWDRGRLAFQRTIYFYTPANAHQVYPFMKHDSTVYARIAPAPGSPIVTKWIWFNRTTGPPVLNLAGIVQSDFLIHTSLLFVPAAILPSL